MNVQPQTSNLQTPHSKHFTPNTHSNHPPPIPSHPSSPSPPSSSPPRSPPSQEEVTRHWVHNFETSNRLNLKPEYASNAAVQRPYKWAHLSPAVVDRAIATIWEQGKPAPRHYYDLGYSEDPKVYNWVLKWLLWHVCRYRDWRNRKTKGGAAGAAAATVVVTGECVRAWAGEVGGGARGPG